MAYVCLLKDYTVRKHHSTITARRDQILTNVLNHTKVSGDACLAVCDERYESSVHWTVHIEKSAHFQRL